MKKLLLLTGLLGLSFGIFAQHSAFLNMGADASMIRYMDSDGNLDEDMSIDINSAFGVGYQYTFDPGVFVRPEISFRQSGGKAYYDTPGFYDYVKWELYYGNFDLAVGYMYPDWQAKPYAGAALYISYLFQANQFGYNSGEIVPQNLIAEEAVEPFDLGVTPILGMQYDISDYAAFLVEARYALGLKNLETNTEQQWLHRALGLRMGMVMNF